MSKLRKVLLASTFVLSATALPAAANDEVIFQANWLIQGENAYMVAGKEQGFYEEEGIDLTINRGFGSGDTIKKVVTGVATIGAADSGTMMLAATREGLPLRCISSEYTYSPQSVWTLANVGIDSIADLEGKRFGITAGNSMQVYWPLLAEANDLDPDSVTFVTMEASALLPTLLAGQIDAMTGFATVIGLRNEEAKTQGKELFGMPMADYGLKVSGECQFASEATIGSNPDLIKRYLRATKKSLEWSRDNPEETAEIISAAYPELNRDSVLLNHLAFMEFVFNETSEQLGVGGFDMEQMQRTFDIVAEAQGLSATTDVSRFIDPTMLPTQ